MGETPNASPLSNGKVPESVDNAVKNLTDKPTQSIGQTISDLWQLVLGASVSFAAEKRRLKYAFELEEYRKSLEAKVAAIPEEKRTEPQLQITAQALDDSKYCVEIEELRKMFSSLIANSMNTDYAAKVHPSFSKMIQQMSSLDAQMLQIFQASLPEENFALVDYVKRDSDGYTTLAACIPDRFPNGCSPFAASRSIVCLQRLGLIQIHTDVYFTGGDRYNQFMHSQLHETLSQKAKISGYQLDVDKYVGTITPLGKDFISVCLG